MISEQQGLATYCCSSHSLHVNLLSKIFATFFEWYDKQDIWKTISHQSSVGNSAEFSLAILSERISLLKLSFKSISFASHITACCVCKVGVLQQTLSKRRTFCIYSPVKQTRGSVKSLRFFDKFMGASETKGKEEFAPVSLFCACICSNFYFLIMLSVSWLWNVWPSFGNSSMRFSQFICTWPVSPQDLQETACPL